MILDIDEEIRLRKVEKEEWHKALEWYSDRDIMYYSEGIIDRVYDLSDIHRMYNYLSSSGELYFIEAYVDNQWISIGDVTLMKDNLPIVIGNKEYWGMGIGKKVIRRLIVRAREIGYGTLVVPEIYHYNERSRKLFVSLGFVRSGKNDRSESYMMDIRKYREKEQV